MTKKTKINNHSQYKPHIIIFACVVSLVAIVGVVFISQSIFGRKDPNPETIANIALMQKASEERNAQICDQISGGIEETDFNKDQAQTNINIADGAAAHYRAMSEFEAKEQCRKHVQQVIDAQDQLQKDSQ